MSFKDIMLTTWSEYEKLWLANQYKSSFEMATLRRIEATIINYGGMGVEKAVSPLDCAEIPLFDMEDVSTPIRTKEKALELFKRIIS